MKTKSLRAVLIAFIMALMTVIPLCFTGCKGSGSNNIDLNVSHTIYEYDVTTHHSGDIPLEDNIIKIGQYYRVVFDITCDDLKATLQEDVVDVQMTVNMGDYENDENRRKLLSSNVASNGGLKFEEEMNGTGVWLTTFTISKNGMPDFSKVDFIIRMATMGLLEVPSADMTISFKVLGKDNHKIQVSSADLYAVTLRAIQGDMSFTKKDNIISSSTGLNSILVIVPEKCISITVEIFFDSDEKNGRYGDKTFGEDQYTGAGTNKFLELNFKTLMIEFIGKVRYDALMEKSDTSIYVALTANGGKNYNSVKFGFTYVLEG